MTSQPRLRSTCGHRRHGEKARELIESDEHLGRYIKVQTGLNLFLKIPWRGSYSRSHTLPSRSGITNTILFRATDIEPWPTRA